MYTALTRGSEASISGIRLELRDGDPPRYVRDGYEVLLAGIDRLLIHPAPPIYLPILGLFRHVLIPVKPPVIVGPKAEIELVRRVVSDIAVSTPTEEVEYVDVFPLRTPKMAVYGRTADGLLCRYMFPGEGPGTIEVPIRIRSDCRHPVTLSRIVVPTSLFRIYYSPGTEKAATAPLEVTLECDVAVVRAGDEPGDMVPIPLETERMLTRRMQVEPRILRTVLAHVEEFIMDRGY